MNFETDDNEDKSLIVFHPSILKVKVSMGIERITYGLCSLILLDADGNKKSLWRDYYPATALLSFGITRKISSSYA